MKIQEMKSGISHLSKKVESKGRSNVFEMRPIGEAVFEEDLPITPEKSEIEDPRWSVVSFNQRQAGGLTYQQAVNLMSDLDSHHVSGLYIVTDEAAARMTA